MKTVFLSASHLALDDAAVLAEALIAGGIRVERPERIAIGTGGDWSGDVLAAIMRCDVFIAMFHAQSLNVMLELGCALGSGKSVLVIRLGEAEIPHAVASFRSIEVDRLDGRTLNEIVKWIQRVAIPPRPPAYEFGNWTAKLRRMCEDESYLDRVSATEFESCIASVLRDLQLHVTEFQGKGDAGYDFAILNLIPNVKALVEVKKRNRNSRVSVAEVQRIGLAAIAEGADVAIVISSSGFTSSARFVAAESLKPVLLLTIDQLLSSTRDGLAALCTEAVLCERSAASMYSMALSLRHPYVAPEFYDEGADFGGQVAETEFVESLLPLSRDASVAVAIRAAKRVQPLFELPESVDGMERHVLAVDEAIRAAESWLGGIRRVDYVKAAGDAAAEARDMANAFACESATHVAAAVRAVTNTIRASTTVEAVAAAINAIRNAVAAAASAGEEHSAIMVEAVADLGLIKAQIKASTGLLRSDAEFSDSGPIGPLWPDGPPEWYLGRKKRLDEMLNRLRNEDSDVTRGEIVDLGGD